jgi:tRNA(Ile)-lysidine synthase
MTTPPRLKLSPDLAARFAGLFAPFRHVVLAVSGGSDSMALMSLVAEWLRAEQATDSVTVTVATVDHRLRAESAREAEWVAEHSRALGLSHTTLVWSEEKPSSGVQERAREARYALLAAHARAHPPAAVVTAHTADDQAETLLMRLGRGSGIDGLAGMAMERPLLPDGSVRLVRPLLAVTKAQLLSVLEDAGLPWLEDPSNDRTDFERVRLRRSAAHLDALGLSNDKLALSASRLMRAREALDRVTDERLRALVATHGGVFASLPRQAWQSEPQEIRVRVLARLLAAYGGEAKPARLSQVEALDDALTRDDRPHAQTLGGCILSKGRTTLRLYREPPAVAIPGVLLRAGQDVLWDWRFRVRYADGAGDAVSVRPLGLAAYATLRDRSGLDVRPPARAAAGLPAIWRGDELLAVPPLADRIAGDSRFSAEFVGLDRQAG